MLTGKLHNKFVYSRRMQRLKELLLPMLKDSQNVLDVGCGDGKIDSLIIEQRPDLKITGIDVLVRDKTYIPVREYDGEHIPIEEEQPDTIMVIDVLHHTDDPAGLVKEMASCTGKYLLIKDHYCYDFISCIKLRLMDYVGNAHYHVRLPYHYLSPSEWTEIFQNNGLKVVCLKRELNLYTGLMHTLFDGRLHFIAKLVKEESYEKTV